MKTENEELKGAKQAMELEIMKLKAAQILSGPQEVGSTADDEDDDDDEREEMHGDQEGLATFTEKMLKRAYFDASSLNNTFQQISASLPQDLEEFRRILRYRLFFIGQSGCGKSTVVKCMLNNTPIIKAVPEVVSPTIHPSVVTTYVEDPYTSKGDWYKAYVQFVDVEAPQQQAAGGVLNMLNPLNVFQQQSKGVADPAKVFLELVDIPGEPTFFNSMPSNLLPGKNAIYCITYDMTLPFDSIKAQIESYLATLHASVSRNYSKLAGGDAPRVGFCLIGTHKDEARDKSDLATTQFLNKLLMALGDVFFRMRGEDTAGLICVGNFACSARDWAVSSTKGDRGPKSFRDLAQFLSLVATQLYPNTPTNLLPSSKDTASHVTYVMGDDVMESAIEKTSHLLPVQQRLRKGVVTLLTGLAREQKSRWIMSEKEMRNLIAEHLDVNQSTSFGNRCVNYVLREIAVRGIFAVVPHAILEPKYLPKSAEETTPSYKPLPRDGIVVLDTQRLMFFYSLFMAPHAIAKLPPTHPILKDVKTLLFDATQLSKVSTIWQRGFVQQDLLQVLFANLLKFFSNETKLLTEFLSVMGLGLSLRAETAMLSSGHNIYRISPLLTDYLPFLVSVHGDGVGRRYRLNAGTRPFFSRLQTKLIPFTNAPSKDQALIRLNWQDCSVLVVEKSRLKWGIFGSRALKDAVIEVNTPVRGILKIEGDLLFVAITARGTDSGTMIKVSRTIMDAIHKEICVMCSRDYRGVKAQFQELTIAGCDVKRQRLHEGIETILSRHDVAKNEIEQQKEIIGTFSKGKEIEDAINALKQDQCDDQ